MNIRHFFSYRFSLLLLCLGLCSTGSLSAQSFFGYQTIGRSTVFFSVAWQGKPLLGVGYNHRAFGKTFTDIQAECRFPVNAMYRFDEFQVIAGMYKPLKVKRAFMGTGAHLRLQKQTTGEEKTTQLQLALTALPTYTYAASLNDGAYGTVAARITYAPVLLARRGTGAFQPLAAHGLELGAHVDLHMERTLGLALNGFLRKDFFTNTSVLTQDSTWKMEGDFYMGSTYRLGRN
jgi:hypothetical protein